MKRIFPSILVIGSLLLTACAAPTTAPPAEAPPTEQPTPTTYTLSLSVSPSGAGSVSPSDGQYEEGTQVTLTATPASGYTFDYWDGDASGSSATITITMDSDKNVIANFTQITYHLTIDIVGNGTTSPPAGVHSYPSGTGVELTATPDKGWEFSSWSGDITDTSATTQITMDSDKSITAHFADATPPVISEVDISHITESGATISWVTDEPATSQVDYGKTTDYGLTTTLDEELVTSHSINLSGLEPDTNYHFRVKSKDGAGNEAVSGNYTFTTLKAATEVGGIIPSNTIWTKQNSPYVVTHTIQIPAGVTLTIEPGVTITMPGTGDMFLLHGTISARGTSQDKIIFDGGGNSNFFSAKGSSSDTFLDLAYCIIKNGISFWPPTGHEQYGYFSLRHSELTNLTGYSYIWYPGRDIHIEYNKFTNAGGFSVGHSGDVKVYIQYNLFDKKNPGLPSYADFWIQNWASYGSSATIVKYNSFINTEGIALKLPSGYDSAAMSATENYWGTQDTDVIDAMIYDRSDDITCAGYINYLPILTEPHPSTPS